MDIAQSVCVLAGRGQGPAFSLHAVCKLDQASHVNRKFVQLREIMDKNVSSEYAIRMVIVHTGEFVLSCSTVR